MRPLRRQSWRKIMAQMSRSLAKLWAPPVLMWNGITILWLYQNLEMPGMCHFVLVFGQLLCHFVIWWSRLIGKANVKSNGFELKTFVSTNYRIILSLGRQIVELFKKKLRFSFELLKHPVSWNRAKFSKRLISKCCL